MNEDKRFAVLIDADNVSDKYIKYIFDELAKSGIITYKRIYGDWTRPDLGSWKKVLLDYSITPIQQYGYTTGKNATDSAMIIDAMDILYCDNVEVFCILSSVSDFTRLVSCVRLAGMYVVGMGEKKTPSPFIASCNQFKYLEILGQEENNGKQKDMQDSITPLESVIKAIETIADDISDDDGWSPLSDIGNIISKRFPDFDVRNYGFSKLTPFVSSLKKFDVKSINKNNIKLIYIKKKPATA